MNDRQEDGWRALCDAVRGAAAGTVAGILREQESKAAKEQAGRIISEALREQEREAAKEEAARKIGMAVIEILEEAAPFIAAAADKDTGAGE